MSIVNDHTVPEEAAGQAVVEGSEQAVRQQA